MKTRKVITVVAVIFGVIFGSLGIISAINDLTSTTNTESVSDASTDIVSSESNSTDVTTESSSNSYTSNKLINDNLDVTCEVGVFDQIELSEYLKDSNLDSNVVVVGRLETLDDGNQLEHIMIMNMNNPPDKFDNEDCAYDYFDSALIATYDVSKLYYKYISQIDNTSKMVHLRVDYINNKGVIYCTIINFAELDYIDWSCSTDDYFSQVGTHATNYDWGFNEDASSQMINYFDSYKYKDFNNECFYK